MRRATPTRTKKTTATSKIAQQIYLRRANVATRIVAKYASAETVPTGLISGGGIKPLTNKAQQPQPPAKPQKAQASPARTTQPPAPAIDPMPANVPPPPYIPPPESGLPPGQPLAPRKQAAASGSFDSKLDMSSVGGKSTDLSSVGGKSVAGFRNGMNSDATAFSNRANLEATQHVTPPPGANYTAHRRRIVNGREVYNDTRSSAHPTWTPTAEYNARFGNPAAPASPATPTTAAAPAPQAIAPGTNMATGKPITPAEPVIAPTTESAQTEIAPPGQPTGQPSGQPSGQPAGQNQQNVTPAAAGQPTTAGQPTGQPTGQTAPRPAAEQHAAAEKSLAAAAAPDAPPEAKQQAETDLKGALAAGAEANPAHTAGAKAILSNDTKNPDAVAFQKHLDEKVSDEVITQKVEAAYRENPNPTPEQAGGIFAQAQQFWSDLPLPAKIMLGLGLPLGLVGLGSSVFGEGGLSGLLTGALGLGVAGMVGANYGLFGNDARQMMGQGAIGLGRAMGMNIPGKEDFTPEGMAKRQQQVTADVQAAMDAKNDKGQLGGWQAGQQKLDEARNPLDYLASMDEGTAITTLMGAMETNDPSVAKQQYDMLMQKRQELLDPEFLRTQARGHVLQNLPGGDWRETVESRPVLKSLANQALNYVGYGAYPAAQK